MDTKILIVGFLSTFLIASVYSSSSTFVFATENLVGCSSGGKGNFRTCVTADDQTGETHIYVCTTLAGKWTCAYVEPVPRTSDISDDLSNALNEVMEDTTKIPKPDLLQDLLEENNEKTAPKIPEDLVDAEEQDEE